MYGTGTVASVAFAELTGIASTTSTVASPETEAANQRPTVGPRTVTPKTRCIPPQRVAVQAARMTIPVTGGRAVEHNSA